jgi:hypothetical protein
VTGAAWALVIGFAINRWSLPAGLLTGVALLPAMIVLSRRTSARRQLKAHEAEIANAKLLDSRSDLIR